MQARDRKDRYMVTKTSTIPFDQVTEEKKDIPNFIYIGSSCTAQIGANLYETKKERHFYVLESRYPRFDDIKISKTFEDEKTPNKGAFPMRNKNPNKVFGKKGRR